MSEPTAASTVTAVPAKEEDAPWTTAEQVVYAVPGDEKGGRLIVYGNKNASNILLFSGGYPDNVHAFMPMASKFATENDCLCGVICLPGYDTHHENWKREGYTFDELVVAYQEATKVLKTLSTAEAAKLVGVFHDWGCALGSMLTNRMNEETPGTFSKIIYFDILPAAHKSHKIAREGFSRKRLAFLSYTSVYAFSNAVQRYLSTYLGNCVFVIGSIFLRLFGFAPIGKLDRATLLNRTEPKYSLSKIVYMAYTYYQFYMGKIDIDREVYLPESLDKTPVLYMYGLCKNFMFHESNVFEWLKKECAKEGSKSKIVPVDQAGHWLYLHQPQICYEEVKRFVFES